MENTSTPVTTTSVGIRYGVLTGLASIIFSFILLATAQEGNMPLSLLGFIIWVGGVVLAHKFFKANNGGFMSYGQGLGIGTVLSAVSGAMGSIFRYVYTEFIDPSVAQRAMDTARAKMESQGMDDAQIDQAVAMSQKFSSGPIGIVIGLVFSVVIGFILSLIISAITKNNRPEFE
jgi:tetrahydromethanopterin S-methyltransferase subunit G